MKKEQVLGIVRHALTFVAGILVVKGIGSDAVFTEITGGVLGLIGAIWSVVDKASNPYQ